jgi:hypothetical protein
MQFRRKGPRAVAAALTAALALPAAASAHVTLQPTTAPAGEFTRLDVRVPNERDDAGTVKVDVRLPQPSPFVSYEPRPGWKVTMKRTKLAKPIEVEGFEVTEGVSQITWTGDGRQGIVRPGQFVDFGLSLRMPDGSPGDKLTFKPLQTYQGDGDDDARAEGRRLEHARDRRARRRAARPRRGRHRVDRPAHVRIKSISPKPGSKVARSLEQVKVRFKGNFVDGHLKVTGPGGAKASIGDGSLASRKRVLRVRLKDHLARGKYRASSGSPGPAAPTPRRRPRGSRCCRPRRSRGSSVRTRGT